jgi:hypothetical protein
VIEWAARRPQLHSWEILLFSNSRFESMVGFAHVKCG